MTLKKKPSKNKAEKDVKKTSLRKKKLPVQIVRLPTAGNERSRISLDEMAKTIRKFQKEDQKKKVMFLKKKLSKSKVKKLVKKPCAKAIARRKRPYRTVKLLTVGNELSRVSLAQITRTIRKFQREDQKKKKA